MSGVVGPLQILLIAGIYIIVIIYSLIMVLKNERGSLKVIWILVIMLLPFIGSVLYLFKHYTGERK